MINTENMSVEERIEFANEMSEFADKIKIILADEKLKIANKFLKILLMKMIIVDELMEEHPTICENFGYTKEEWGEMTSRLDYLLFGKNYN